MTQVSDRVSEPGRKGVPGCRTRDRELSWPESRCKCSRSRQFVGISRT